MDKSSIKCPIRGHYLVLCALMSTFGYADLGVMDTISEISAKNEAKNIGVSIIFDHPNQISNGQYVVPVEYNRTNAEGNGTEFDPNYAGKSDIDYIPLSQLKGAKGDTGTTGNTGATGQIGAMGFRGETGAVGASGQTGKIGEVGPQGSTGSQGLTGPIGHQGFTGAQGVSGNKGDQGQRGNQGIQGLQGVQGPKGDSADVPAIDPRFDVEVREWDTQHWSLSSFASFGLQDSTARYIVGQKFTLKLGDSYEARELAKLRKELGR